MRSLFVADLHSLFLAIAVSRLVEWDTNPTFQKVGENAVILNSRPALRTQSRVPIENGLVFFGCRILSVRVRACVRAQKEGKRGERVCMCARETVVLAL